MLQICTIFLLFALCASNPLKAHSSGQATSGFSVMLDPAGDAKNSGRTIGDSFERGITLQFTEALKKTLEDQQKDIRIVLTRLPGETVRPLQQANFANRLDVDLYLSINFYQEKETRPKVYLYHFSYGDEFITKTYDLCFYRYDKAHLINYPQTASYAKTMKEVLSLQEFERLFDFQNLYALPFKPLIGIKAPALALEISLKNKTDWKHYLEPVARGITLIISHQHQGN